LEDLVSNITVEISELQESRVEQGRVNEELQRGMAEQGQVNEELQRGMAI
jgi:hypothetical protein